MKINVKVHSKSSKEEIKKTDNKSYEVWLKQPALQNKANVELVKLLKKYFKREVKLIKGFKLRNKIIEIR